jgi:hypothetical protein
MKAPRYRGDALARKNNHYLECVGQPNDVVEDNHPPPPRFTPELEENHPSPPRETTVECKNHDDHGVSMIVANYNYRTKISINRSACFIVKGSQFLYLKGLHLSLI